MTSHDDAEKGVQDTLKELGLDYIDLFLLHFPVGEKTNGTALTYKLDHGSVRLSVQSHTRLKHKANIFVGLEEYGEARPT